MPGACAHRLPGHDGGQGLHRHPRQCRGRGGGPGLPLNPANVKRVEGLLSESQFNFLFPLRAPEYTYRGFLQAVAKFPAFCGDYSDGRNAEAICRKSLATMFAHFAQETGGHELAPRARVAPGPGVGAEMGWTEQMRGGYNAECRPDVAGAAVAVRQIRQRRVQELLRSWRQAAVVQLQLRPLLRGHVRYCAHPAGQPGESGGHLAQPGQRRVLLRLSAAAQAFHAARDRRHLAAQRPRPAKRPGAGLRGDHPDHQRRVEAAVRPSMPSPRTGSPTTRPRPSIWGAGACRRGARLQEHEGL